MSKDGRLQKSKLFILVCAGMILPAAFLFMLKADVPHVFLITFIGLNASLLIQKPIKYSDRSVIYGILSAIVIAYIFELMFKVDRSRLGTFSDIFMSHLAAPTLLYLAVLATFYESTPHTLGFSSCFSLAVVMLCGDRSYSDVPAQKLGLFFEFYDVPDQVYVTVIGIEVVFVLMALRLSRRIAKPKRRTKRPRLRLAVRTLTLVLIPLLAYIGREIFLANENNLKALEQKLIQMGYRRSRGRHVIFNDRVDLNRTVSPQVQENNAQILLRVRSATPPGYLRGRVYTVYKEGHWTTPEGSKETQMPLRQQEGILAFNIFYFTDQQPAENAMHIYPSGDFSSDVLLYPGNAGQFEIVADRMKMTPNGVLKPEDWEKDGGYTAFVKKAEPFPTFPAPEVPIDPYLLQVSDDIYRPISIETQTILRQQMVRKGATTKEKVAALVGYFHRNFEYQLGTENVPGVDPVIHFLKDKKKGHCELFASSLALMLRSQGIATRYVTGFVCQEKHPSDSYYVSRLGHAHAWVEVFLSEEKKWVLAEPTPASGIPNFEHKWGIVETWLDRLKHSFQQVLADMRRGYFAKAIVAAVTGVFGFIWDFLAHPVRGVVFLIVVVGLMVLRRYRLLARRKRTITLDGQVLALQREFQNLEKRLTKKLSVPRDTNMTIREWLGALEKEAEQIPDQLRQAMMRYESLRFRPEPPSTEEITDIRKAFKQV